MRHKEYHYRVPSIYRQIEKLQYCLNQEKFFRLTTEQRLAEVNLEIANIKLELTKAQSYIDKATLLKEMLNKVGKE